MIEGIICLKIRKIACFKLHFNIIDALKMQECITKQKGRVIPNLPFKKKCCCYNKNKIWPNIYQFLLKINMYWYISIINVHFFIYSCAASSYSRPQPAHKILPAAFSVPQYGQIQSSSNIKIPPF